MEYDEGRTIELEKFGLTVIRFTNEQVEYSIENVITNLLEICKKKLNH